MCSRSNTYWRVSCIPPPPTPLRPSPCAPPWPPSSPFLHNLTAAVGIWNCCERGQRRRCGSCGMDYQTVCKGWGFATQMAHTSSQVYLCVCVCVYINVYVCICLRIFVYVQRMRRRDANGCITWQGISMCVCMCWYECVCVCICLRIFVCVKLCKGWGVATQMDESRDKIYLCVCVCVRICLHMFMCVELCAEDCVLSEASRRKWMNHVRRQTNDLSNSPLTLLELTWKTFTNGAVSRPSADCIYARPWADWIYCSANWGSRLNILSWMCYIEYA